jgi:hypothetical protein
MHNKCFFSIVAGLFILSIAAASTSFGEDCETYLEKNWGKSFQSAMRSQTLNPNAGKNLAPVKGLDGLAAELVMGCYRQSFKGCSQGQSPSYNLTMGSTLGGSSVGLITTQK